ncbi:uncharacterized protein LOC126847431 [Adelges cooleyi]|uniref:uncharacterized protein LOC126847431 n=1 Tax=Adelges cooleyi TaxID=133065 RepID=UPI00218032CC|nr:uncharacterized protein LOC126847431 [Adelges cooleyi]
MHLKSAVILCVVYFCTSVWEPTLMPVEVELYLEKFVTLLKDNQNNGFLHHKQLLGLFKELNIKNEELEKAENLIPKDEEGHAIANQAEFLLIMLDVLPEGNGLSQKQLEKFVELYNKTTTRSIDPKIIQKIFKEFEMTRTPHKELFRSNRPAAKELMELLIVTAERSKTAHRNEIVLSTPKVRTLVSNFKKNDYNNNGILSGEEAIEFVKDFLTKDPEYSTTINFYDIKINVAHYVLFHLIKLRQVRDHFCLLENLLRKYELI